MQQFALERFADGVTTTKALFGTWSALTNPSIFHYFAKSSYKHVPTDLLHYDASYENHTATWFSSPRAKYSYTEWTNRDFSARPYTNVAEDYVFNALAYTFGADSHFSRPSYYHDSGTLTGFTLGKVRYDVGDTIKVSMHWKREESETSFVDVAYKELKIRNFDFLNSDYSYHTPSHFATGAEYSYHTPDTIYRDWLGVSHSINNYYTQQEATCVTEPRYYANKKYVIHSPSHFYINARDFSLSSSITSVAEARIAEFLLLTPPVIFKLPAIGYFKLPVRYIEAVIPFGMFVDVPVQHIMDQFCYAAKRAWFV